MSERDLEEHGLAKYEWNTWTDGEEHIIVRGSDYTCTPAGMQAQLSNKVKRLGHRKMADDKFYRCIGVKVTRRDVVITFQYLWKLADIYNEEN